MPVRLAASAIALSSAATSLTYGGDAEHRRVSAIRADECRPAPTPILLPAFDQVVDSVALTQSMAEHLNSAVPMGVLLAVRFGKNGSLERVAMLESTVPADSAQPVALAVASFVRSQPPGSVWGVRLWVEIGPTMSFGVARSQICEPVLMDSPQLGRNVITVNASELDELRHAGPLTVRVLVSDRGQVLRAVVTRGSGSNLHDDVLMRDARSLRFRPGTLDGAPIEMWQEIRVATRPGM